MDSFNTNTLKQKPKAKQKRTNAKSTNFIEALRSLGSSIKKQTKDATLGLGKGAVDQILGASQS